MIIQQCLQDEHCSCPIHGERNKLLKANKNLDDLKKATTNEHNELVRIRDMILKNFGPNSLRPLVSEDQSTYEMLLDLLCFLTTINLVSE